MNREQALIGQDYRLTQQSTVVVPLPVDILMVQGAETLDFLNRLSTNDLKHLGPHEIRTSVLTTEKARIIDVVSLLNPDSDFLLITSPGNGERVKAWLEKFIIMEELEISNVSNDFSRFCILGPDALSRLQSILNMELPVTNNHFQAISYLESRILLFQDPLWSIPMLHVCGPPGVISQIFQNSQSKGMGQAFTAVDPVILETLRIENGIPGYDREINGEVNPLEANLERFVSFTKGCYIGQEVIARIDTYKKLQKKLTGFILDTARTDVILTGTLVSSGTEVGWTTSHAWSFRLNKQIALGYLKTDVDAPTVQFHPQGGGAEMTATISKFPFQLQ